LIWDVMPVIRVLEGCSHGGWSDAGAAVQPGVETFTVAPAKWAQGADGQA
jgi:hypothetical protein